MYILFIARCLFRRQTCLVNFKVVMVVGAQIIGFYLFNSLCLCTVVNKFSSLSVRAFIFFQLIFNGIHDNLLHCNRCTIYYAMIRYLHRMKFFARGVIETICHTLFAEMAVNAHNFHNKLIFATLTSEQT